MARKHRPWVLTSAVTLAIIPRVIEAERIRKGKYIWVPVAILLVGFALRVAWLTVDRFHADEALYAGWALRILDDDPLLVGEPVDKPPLYLYTLAAAFAAFGPWEAVARLPNLAADMLTIALVYRLGARLWSPADARRGWWAALFLALSPFDILFARTAFTDPMLVTFIIGALCAAVERRWLLSGLLCGLAYATKQNAVLLVPLVPIMGALVSFPRRRDALSWGAGLAIPLALTVAWDSARWPVRPGYWEQSALSYGGLALAAPDKWGKRLLEWLNWARYLSGSPLLDLTLVLGSGLSFASGWPRKCRQMRPEMLIALFSVAYLLIHSIFRFSVWDRYLLPLAPLAAILLARVVTNLRLHVRPVAIVLLCLAALIPGWRAAHNGYPVGGEHWAYQGLEQVVDYLLANAPPNAVLYHHWLRWHYTYYLNPRVVGTARAHDFELRWWRSGDHLRREAMRTRGRAQYIVLPDWRTLEPTADGLCLRPLYAAHRADGSVSLRVYRVEVGDSVAATSCERATAGQEKVRHLSGRGRRDARRLSDTSLPGFSLPRVADER